MQIILQGTDEVRFNPVTGKPVKQEKLTKHILSDGRIVVEIGDCNIETTIKPKE